MSKRISVPDEVIVSKIYLIRDQKVMIDRDLAELYVVETKRLKEAVRRNMERFPEDFMFEMNEKELNRGEKTTLVRKKTGKGYVTRLFVLQNKELPCCLVF